MPNQPIELDARQFTNSIVQRIQINTVVDELNKLPETLRRDVVAAMARDMPAPTYAPLAPEDVQEALGTLADALPMATMIVAQELQRLARIETAYDQLKTEQDQLTTELGKQALAAVMESLKPMVVVTSQPPVSEEE